MKRFIYLWVIPYVVFGLHAGKIACQSRDFVVEGNLRVLVLEGDPYERGLNHGRMLKKEIHGLVEKWKADINKTYKMDADRFIAEFVRGTDFIPAIKKHTPDLLEEVRGIADGAGIDFNTMYAFQLVDEMWVIGEEIARNRCTSFGVRKTGKNPTLNAQNLDIPLFYHGYQTLLHIKEPGRKLESFVFTFPGFIGANGMNNRPVSVNVNALMQLEHASDGLPVAFIVRGVLEKETYDDAVKFLHDIKHAAGQNYIIGDVENMASFECSENKVTKFIPFEGANFTYHTNHPLTNDNYSAELLDRIKAENKTPREYDPYCSRFKSLKENFRDNSVAFDVEKLKAIFGSRDWNINRPSTFGCTIMVTSDNPELHISAGRPDEEPFLVFTFTNIE